MRHVIEFVAVGSGEELVQAVARELVGQGVGGKVALCAVHPGEHEERRGEHRHGPQQAVAELPGGARRCAQRRQQPVAQQPHDQPRERGEHHQDPPDGVGLADVADHFARVEQVVHRDEVEARAELLPEEPFGYEQEQRAEHQRPAEGHPHRAVPEPVEDAGRCDEQVQDKGCRRIEVGGEVEVQPQRERGGDFADREGLVVAAGVGEHDPEEKGARAEGEPEDDQRRVAALAPVSHVQFWFGLNSSSI